ncbi:hypothetical protein UFOVP558_28 [uncultured Caudovirales phage]|uniref:Ammonia monooxygenase n=1 Tax=uncultured Caudovirales phage TaxID=2100421 RepID=A0A6J5MSI0_9CAUD|nr:hypothetical protein UFOVP558_28 [uncultured Caudovirales phage]
MTNSKLKGLYSKSGCFVYRCPGCLGTHYIPVVGPKAWGFNWDLEKPTLTPSVVEWSDGYPEEGIPSYRCHHYVREGMIDFLGDCTHKVRGAISLEPIPLAWMDARFRAASNLSEERPT